MTNEHSKNNFMDQNTTQPQANQGAAVLVGSGTLLGVGSSVTWCHSSSNGRSIGFTTRRGKIVQINHENGMAFVKFRGTHLWIRLTRLRSASARTELTEMVMEDASPKASPASDDPHAAAIFNLHRSRQGLA